MQSTSSVVVAWHSSLQLPRSSVDYQNRIRGVKSSLSVQEGTEGKKRKAKQQRKPRFAQVKHKSTSSSSKKESTTSGKSSGKSIRNNTKKPSRKGTIATTKNVNLTTYGKTSTPRVSKPNLSYDRNERFLFDNDDRDVPSKGSFNNLDKPRQRSVPPLQSQKSVEELESIMMKRWGTDASKWTSQKEDEYEFDYSDESSENNQDDDADDISFQMDFYDHDDDGYEPKSSGSNHRNSNVLRVDQVIAPRPAGGRGTNSNSVVGSGGFFFNAPAPKPKQENVKPSPKKTTVAKKAAVPEEDQGPPEKPMIAKLDKDGNPLYLTSEQAQRYFEDAIEESGDELELDSTDEGRSWEELGITSPILLRNLRRMECPAPLPVQDKACPSIISGNDVLVGTYTGSGKTLAFLAPLVQKLLFSFETDETARRHGMGQLRVLIIAPGRELASQIVTVARALLQDTGLNAMLAIGGTGFTRNLQDIRKRKPSIVVGTPGRIAELVVGKQGEKRGRLKVADLESLVLDEFDALLEYKPHRDPTAAIVETLKRRHGNAMQSILCSATATDMASSPKLEQYLRPSYVEANTDDDDVLVTGSKKATNGKVAKTRVSRTVIHGVIHVPHRRFALETIRRILYTDPIPQQILIFVENARKVNIVVEKLASMGIVAAPLCGGSRSEKMDRADVSKALRDGYVGIVVATELAARGLDAPMLTHVVNMDLPTDASHYAHRAGRCGRGGRPGVVINLSCDNKERNVPQKFADALGITMHTVEAKQGKLNIVTAEENIPE